MDQKNLWQDTGEHQTDYPSFYGEMRADVAIIGGGYTGVSAAYHLAQKGISVAVLEAHTIGFGGSGRNVGLVNAGLWLKPSEIRERLPRSEANTLIECLGQAPQVVFDLITENQIKCEALHNGTLHCAHSSGGLQDLEERYAQWRELGAPVELMEREAIAQLTGTSVYRGALFDRRAGIIQPLSYVRGLAQTAWSKGAQIFEHSPVMKAQQTPDGWQLTTPHGLLQSEKVISAGGAYPATGETWQAPQTSTLYYFQAATEPLSADLVKNILPGRQGAWDTRKVLTSFRLDQNNRLIWGSVGRLEGLTAAAHLNWARRDMVRLFPQLNGSVFSHHWYGRLAMTRNNIPRISTPLPGWVSLWAYNGRGIAPGTVFGRAVADYVTGEDEEVLPLKLSPCRGDAFVKAQNFLMELGAALVHGFSARG